MPALLSHKPLPWHEGIEIPRPELELTLLEGTGFSGPAVELRSLDDWRQQWSRWGDAILAKCTEHRPGTRPFAMYVVGLIPPRRFVRPLPAFHNLPTIYVRDGGHGQRWVLAPHHLENEARHLYRLGIIDDEELRRHREWIATHRATGARRRDGYQLEAGRFA
jgi:hypothetical protein